MNWKISRVVIVFFLSAVMFPLAYAAAPPVKQAQSMMAKGNLQGALKVLNTYLKDAPQDADARFTRGLVLTKLKRTGDAIKAFSSLTKDYPQLPEPYNNLAVLYAQKGQYNKAREALKAALATHPSYATASENLGDVYAAMAGQAYNHALMLDKNNQQIRYKLSLINKLNGPSAGGSQIASSAPVQQQTTPAPVSTPPAAPASSASMSSAKQGLSAADKAAVKSALLGWADAWSRQDLNAYFSHYAKNFEPAHHLSHTAWEKRRRARISKPESISVKVRDLHVTAVGGNRARARFKEDYHSNRVSGTFDKELQMIKSDGSWKILRESH